MLKNKIKFWKTEGPATEEEVAVEVERPSDEPVDEGTWKKETSQEEFYANLADDLDERVLQRMASKLVDEYQKRQNIKKRLGAWVILKV